MSAHEPLRTHPADGPGVSGHCKKAPEPILSAPKGTAIARQAFDAAPEHEPEEPTPLVREVPPGEPYPVDALGPLQEVAEAVHDMTQAPVAIGAQSALGVASLAAQALGDVQSLGGPAPCSLFLLTVAGSGERKSSCDRLVMQPVRDFERELADEAREDEGRIPGTAASFGSASESG